MTEALFTDWRGREVRAGDLVAYPTMSGRSCQLAVGTVVSAAVNDKGELVSVEISPVATSRWEQYSSEPRYRNKVTGKSIKINANSHYVQRRAWRRKSDGVIATRDELYELAQKEEWCPRGWYSTGDPSPDKDTYHIAYAEDAPGWERVRDDILKDYVEEVPGPKPIRLTANADSVLRIEQ